MATHKDKPGSVSLQDRCRLKCMFLRLLRLAPMYRLTRSRPKQTLVAFLVCRIGSGWWSKRWWGNLWHRDQANQEGYKCSLTGGKNHLRHSGKQTIATKKLITAAMAYPKIQQVK